MKVIRKLIPLLNDIQIRNNNGRPKSRLEERIWADNTKYHTFLVTDISFYNRRIRAQIRERSIVIPNQNKGDQIKYFLYQDYKKVRSSSGVERFFGWLKSFRESRHDMKD